MRNNNRLEIGCGLIRIGRTWGYKTENIPTEPEVRIFLTEAIKLGVSFFDTAPAYGLSEERLGNFLKTISSDLRKELTIATKCGESWDADKKETIVDHTYESLVKSINKSMGRLGKIDVLQIHKATPSVLRSGDVQEALKYAKSLGIKQLGASISDLATAEVVNTFDELSLIQLPFNPERKEMKDALAVLVAGGKQIIINRPFNMGGLLYKEDEGKTKMQLLSEAYAFIIKEDFNGVILTGTSNVNHLKENLEAFKNAFNQKL